MFRKRDHPLKPLGQYKVQRTGLSPPLQLLGVAALTSIDQPKWGVILVPGTSLLSLYACRNTA